jgi:hypothetical protein
MIIKYNCCSRTWLDTMFSWKIDSTQINKKFEEPYLFSAKYRVYKGAYFYQGFQLCGHVLEKKDNFQKLFDKLPLDIKGIILNKYGMKAMI